MEILGREQTTLADEKDKINGKKLGAKQVYINIEMKYYELGRKGC